MPLRAPLAVFVLCLAGCGPGPSSGKSFAGQQRQAILSGTVDTGDPAVFNLVIFDANQNEYTCSATLIGKRTLLTAAHCVDPAEYGGRLTLHAHNRTTRAEVPDSQLLEITDSRVDPLYDPNTIAHDLGLALLKNDPGVSPVKFNQDPIVTGLPLRAVGYGVSAFDSGGNGYGDGTRRTAPLAVGPLTAFEYQHARPQGHGICDGDSGGPSLATFADGERVVGVHSYTEGNACEASFDQRVDSQADFITGWLSEKEPPLCVANGVCEAGCAHDPDCVGPAITLPQAHAEGPAAAGCAAAPGAVVLLPLALLSRRRRATARC